MTKPTTTSNANVATIWAKGAGDARSSNGQFYNHGAQLFSYGAHYVAAYLVPGYYLPAHVADHRVAVALFNATKVSPTTSKHVTLARHAFFDLPRTGACDSVVAVAVPDLTAFMRFNLGMVPVADDVAQTKIASGFQRILSDHFEQSGQAIPSDMSDLVQGIAA